MWVLGIAVLGIAHLEAWSAGIAVLGIAHLLAWSAGIARAVAWPAWPAAGTGAAGTVAADTVAAGTVAAGTVALGADLAAGTASVGIAAAALLAAGVAADIDTVAAPASGIAAFDRMHTRIALAVIHHCVSVSQSVSE